MYQFLCVILFIPFAEHPWPETNHQHRDSDEMAWQLAHLGPKSLQRHQVHSSTLPRPLDPRHNAAKYVCELIRETHIMFTHLSVRWIHKPQLSTSCHVQKASTSCAGYTCIFEYVSNVFPPILGTGQILTTSWVSCAVTPSSGTMVRLNWWVTPSSSPPAPLTPSTTLSTSRNVVSNSHLGLSP